MVLVEDATTSAALSSSVTHLVPTVMKDVGGAADTPADGYGVLYVNSDELCFKNDSAVIHNLSTRAINTIQSAFWTSSTSGYYLTLAGASTGESSSLSTASYSGMYVAPYNGKFLRIANFNQSTSSKTTTLELYIDGDDSDLTGDQRGTDLSSGSYTNKFQVDCPADWTFTKGEALAIRKTDTAAAYGVTMTIIVEYDLST